MYLLLLLICGDIESQPGPSSNSQDTRTLFSKRGLKMLHQNIRGLQEKFDEVSDLLLNNEVNIF